ncbi:hypothetical protein O0I10_011026 [Lichtheimia ornata]|uniref:Uncharacterized protein n=1 Tax=Lichtheimia ornata TaxID=688661 RepID=A0AAD7UTP0_9FUNG|nr:uncharacterized protein O0I10_011026 [Lichtheimia ornata]KAJ8653277.1 hypothetical protein O0I10_011026 [Lichtheimia ornata]
MLWKLKERLEDTLLTMKKIAESHKENMIKDILEDLPDDKNLSILVEPLRVPITERLHLRLVPPHPDSSFSVD